MRAIALLLAAGAATGALAKSDDGKWWYKIDTGEKRDCDHVALRPESRCSRLGKNDV
eukprot:CAMPEP_0119270482 /NCGR_PEP_ID=MMETSP1329-20130426/7468_1 /TAXON_ID=114041 /ORGANISM="Genus nov. species nov., Strain RCC1024" /LENGTH=56 /DNA_ID=CAMNT_0007270505 /DNA_START=171 /DNA_END=337 /DNA_ORIENTATION=+